MIERPSIVEKVSLECCCSNLDEIRKMNLLEGQKRVQSSMRLIEKVDEQIGIMRNSDLDALFFAQDSNGSEKRNYTDLFSSGAQEMIASLIL
jgi:hypothetical protein